MDLKLLTYADNTVVAWSQNPLARDLFGSCSRKARRTKVTELEGHSLASRYRTLRCRLLGHRIDTHVTSNYDSRHNFVAVIDFCERHRCNYRLTKIRRVDG